MRRGREIVCVPDAVMIYYGHEEYLDNLEDVRGVGMLWILYLTEGEQMNKPNKLSHLTSVLLYVISIALYLVSGLSTVSQTFVSDSVFTYSYNLRVATECLAIACAAVAPFLGKSNKWIKVTKIVLSILIIGFILILGFRMNMS